ncbi:MAG: hypothetical protein KC621_17480, partial [Myxococcales bacterium]|nr:hypothetical protein [Myxococcales bacterium]
MRRSMLALLALLPAANAMGPSEAPASPTMPSGQVVYRPECFGHAAEEKMANRGPSNNYSPSPAASGAGASTGHRGGRKSAPASAPQSAPPPPPVAISMEIEEESPVIQFGRDKPIDGDAGGAADLDDAVFESSKPAKGKQKEVAATDEGFALAEPVATEQPVNTRKEVAQRPAAPVLDWGGTVWLSNDDSMSLAS